MVLNGISHSFSLNTIMKCIEDQFHKQIILNERNQCLQYMNEGN